jgi:hypothetical protein
MPLGERSIARRKRSPITGPATPLFPRQPALLPIIAPASSHASRHATANGLQPTIRQYRGAILQAIDDCTDMTAADRAQLVERIKCGPAPRDKGAKPRTSARKRRPLPFEQFKPLVRELMSRNHPDVRIAARFIAHNCLLFLRPIEWETARIVGDVLTIQNAKATNGRSFGAERELDLTDYGAAGVTDLADFLSVLHARAVTLGGFRRFWICLAARIARACERIGIRRVALYTSRHCGISNAKSWMLPEEVAASAGRKTTVTATSHYAKRRSGCGPPGQARRSPAAPRRRTSHLFTQSQPSGKYRSEGKATKRPVPPRRLMPG